MATVGDTEVALATIILMCAVKKMKARAKRKRTVWVKEWLGRRGSLDAYHALLRELRKEKDDHTAEI